MFFPDNPGYSMNLPLDPSLLYSHLPSYHTGHHHHPTLTLPPPPPSPLMMGYPGVSPYDHLHLRSLAPSLFSSHPHYQSPHHHHAFSPFSHFAHRHPPPPHHHHPPFASPSCLCCPSLPDTRQLAIETTGENQCQEFQEYLRRLRDFVPQTSSTDSSSSTDRKISTISTGSNTEKSQTTVSKSNSPSTPSSSSSHHNSHHLVDDSLQDDNKKDYNILPKKFDSIKLRPQSLTPSKSPPSTSSFTSSLISENVISATTNHSSLHSNGNNKKRSHEDASITININNNNDSSFKIAKTEQVEPSTTEEKIKPMTDAKTIVTKQKATMTETKTTPTEQKTTTTEPKGISIKQQKVMMTKQKATMTEVKETLYDGKTATTAEPQPEMAEEKSILEPKMTAEAKSFKSEEKLTTDEVKEGTMTEQKKSVSERKTSSSKSKTAKQANLKRRRFRSGMDMIRQSKKKKSSKGTIEKQSSSSTLPQKTGHNERTPTTTVVDTKKLMANKSLGETILHRAARQGYTDVVRSCLETGSIDINARDNAGYTPLHECCTKGHLDIARLLLAAGADVNAFAAGGIYPLHDAVECDHVEIARLLLSYGADPTIATYGGMTPVKLSHSKVMSHLLRGFLNDLNGETSSGGNDKDHSLSVLPWKFSAIRPPRKYGVDVFSEPPPEADDSPQPNHKEVIIEESDRPLCSTFTIRLGSDHEPKVVARLLDVSAHLGTSREDLDKRLSVFSVESFESRALCNQLFSRDRRNQDDSRPTEVVLWDDVRNLMGVHVTRLPAES